MYISVEKDSSEGVVWLLKLYIYILWNKGFIRAHLIHAPHGIVPLKQHVQIVNIVTKITSEQDMDK